MHHTIHSRGRLSIQFFLGFFLCVAVLAPAARAVTPEEIRARGELRHLGLPYANFVTGQQDGLDTDLMRLFAKHLGAKYTFVETQWDTMFADLTGKPQTPGGAAPAQPRGDILASGITIFPWREKLVRFSTPTFPTQVWLVTNAQSPLLPITPGATVEADIKSVRTLLRGISVLGKAHTCTDPTLYDLEKEGARIVISDMNLNMLAPAILRNEADAVLLDVPDALVALSKWPGQFKIIGPISDEQRMGVVFSPDSEALCEAFNTFFRRCLLDGTYEMLVKKYYPDAIAYFQTYFGQMLNDQAP